MFKTVDYPSRCSHFLPTRRALVPLCITLALSLSAEANAQFPDLLELSGQYLPSVELDDPVGVEAQVASYDASINVPIILSDTRFLIPGLAYHVDSVSFPNAPSEFIELRAFHSVDVALLYVQLLPKDWALSLRLAPGLAGDFAAVDVDMFHVSALAMATRGFSDKLVFGFGALASYSFGEFLPLPSIYLDWQPQEWLRFETFLPAFAHLDFIIGDRVEVGPRLDVAGNEYAVREARIQNSPACAGESRDQCLDHLAYSIATAGVQVGGRLTGSLWLTVFSGRTVFRRFEMQNARGRLLDGGVEDLPPSWFIRTSLTFRIPMGDSDQ